MIQSLPASSVATIAPSSPRYRSLFCSLIWPRYPGHSGGEIRDFHLVRHLASLSDLEFFALHDLPGEGQEDRLAEHVRARHDPRSIATSRPELIQAEGYPGKVLDRVVRRLRRAHVPVPGPRYHFDVEMQLVNARTWSLGALREALGTGAPDFLFVSPQVNPVALLLPEGGHTRLVMASYDVERVRMQRFAEAARGLAAIALRWEASRAARFEADNLRRFDGVIAVSELDRQHYLRDYGFAEDRVLVVENGVDPEYFAFGDRTRTEPPQVVYVGNLRYPPNAEAAVRLVRRIMPIVWRSRPDAQAVIVGDGPPPDVQAEARPGRVIVTGRVSDVRPHLTRAWVGCVPLRAGSGTKYKVLEALAAGVPLVCSPLAVEGLDLEAGRHLAVAASDDDLAREVVRLLDDAESAGALARRGRERVEERYAWDVNLPRLAGWLDWLRREPPRSGTRRP
ncbi:MAG TPA: glycosyltransferase family 4 protein [Vicinamibacteria bacterium]|nr:glycosyltransferase family 4 protein [Vicinamibacteria bacterium]